RRRDSLKKSDGMGRGPRKRAGVTMKGRETLEHILDNGELTVKLSSAGGSFTSIASNGREYLWQGDPAVWSGQAPICFPICGGLRDNRATALDGKKIELARHGFARKQEFELIEAGETSCAFRLSSTPELLAQYPYDFELVARYAIEGKTLEVSYEVTNHGDADMPFFVGGHPGFACPLDEGESYTDYKLRFEADEAADLCTAVPSTGLIDVENRSANPMVGRDLPLTHELFDFAETIFDVLNSRTVKLVSADGGKGVRVTFPDMPYLIVWSKPEGDFVAIEPWGGLSTCSDEDDVFEHKRGCLVAKPGETVVRGFAVEVF
ncbi:MAG: aldose 1-epimerase family protein, partial [Collinsella sp.]|nr:aldose 1-epimerase family protein [Collinsella sp.]